MCVVCVCVYVCVCVCVCVFVCVHMCADGWKIASVVCSEERYGRLGRLPGAFSSASPPSFYTHTHTHIYQAHTHTHTHTRARARANPPSSANGSREREREFLPPALTLSLSPFPSLPLSPSLPLRRCLCCAAESDVNPFCSSLFLTAAANDCRWSVV